MVISSNRVPTYLCYEMMVYEINISGIHRLILKWNFCSVQSAVYTGCYRGLFFDNLVVGDESCPLSLQPASSVEVSIHSPSRAGESRHVD